MTCQNYWKKGSNAVITLLKMFKNWDKSLNVFSEDKLQKSPILNSRYKISVLEEKYTDLD